MKILWQNPTTPVNKSVPGFDGMGKKIEEYFNSITNEATEVQLRSMELSTNTVRSFYGEFVNNYHMVETVLQLQKENKYDGIIIGCFPDPGLNVLREMCDVPIIGLGEAAMLVAATLGEKFAVISVDDDINPNMEQSFLKYGLDGRAIPRPMRAVHPPITAIEDVEGYTDPYKAIIPKIEKTAMECIKDGAEVLLTGCGYIGPMLSLHNYRIIRGTNVPIVNSSAVAVKFAEMMVGLDRLGIKVSRHNYYKKPSEELTRLIRRNVGLPDLGNVL